MCQATSCSVQGDLTLCGADSLDSACLHEGGPAHDKPGPALCRDTWFLGRLAAAVAQPAGRQCGTFHLCGAVPQGECGCNPPLKSSAVGLMAL